MNYTNRGYKKLTQYIVKCKCKRWRCLGISDHKPCNCKTQDDCRMTQFVRDWQAIDELYLLESLK